MNDKIEWVSTAWDYWDEYAFGSDVIFKIPELKHDIRPKTNQNLNDETLKACTIVGSVNQLIRLFWLELDNKQQDKLCVEVVKYCTQYWYRIGHGWSTVDAINSVAKWWNNIGYKTFNKEKIFYSRVNWWDKRIKEALDKGHLVGFTYALNWNTDRYAWLVYKNSYPWWTWHRTNIKGVKFVNATSGLKLNEWEANEWVHDNYYIFTNEYYIKDIWKYISKGVYPAFYIVLPRSCMVGTVEKEKERIVRLKAVNATIWVLTSTWWDLNNDEQLMSSALATELRNTDWARERIENQEIKVYQSIVDILSYAWKFAWNDEQKRYSELASYLRKKYNLK